MMLLLPSFTVGPEQTGLTASAGGSTEPAGLSVWSVVLLRFCWFVLDGPVGPPTVQRVGEAAAAPVELDRGERLLLEGWETIRLASEHEDGERAGPGRVAALTHLHRVGLDGALLCDGGRSLGDGGDHLGSRDGLQRLLGRLQHPLKPNRVRTRTGRRFWTFWRQRNSPGQPHTSAR